VRSKTTHSLRRRERSASRVVLDERRTVVIFARQRRRQRGARIVVEFASHDRANRGPATNSESENRRRRRDRGFPRASEREADSSALGFATYRTSSSQVERWSVVDVTALQRRSLESKLCGSREERESVLVRCDRRRLSSLARNCRVLVSATGSAGGPRAGAWTTGRAARQGDVGERGVQSRPTSSSSTSASTVHAATSQRPQKKGHRRRQANNATLN